jgi:hypothetical protein
MDDEIIVPPFGTRVEVLSRYSLAWMNQYRRPTVGVVSPSNSWDRPGTFRLTRVENPNHMGEATITRSYVQYIKVLDNHADTTEAPLVADSAHVFEIKGSKGDIYQVTLDGPKSSCTCQAGKSGRLCKHVKAAREMLID